MPPPPEEATPQVRPTAGATAGAAPMNFGADLIAAERMVVERAADVKIGVGTLPTP